MADGNGRLTSGFFFYALPRRPFDHAGDAAAHDAQTVRRIDNDLNFRVKNAAVHDRYLHSSVNHVLHFYWCQHNPARILLRELLHRSQALRRSLYILYSLSVQSRGML